MKLKAHSAGTFYPASARSLEKLLDSFEVTPVVPLPGPAVGLLLPHAGYIYSGMSAALGYRSLHKKPDLMVVVGPSHHVRFVGTAVFNGSAVETPLGDLPVDREAVEILMQADKTLGSYAPAFEKEHSAEVHFPLIKHFCPKAQVLALVTGQGGEETAEPLSRALFELSKARDLVLVASSDLSHYPQYDIAVEADRSFLDAVLNGTEKEVLKADERLMKKGWIEYHCSHCGHEPLMTLMKYARLRGAEKRVLLDYHNSGDVTGDKGQVVGYGSVAFCR